tara:strand:+ start:156 stop:404 length:249 start_codon:yes stop_codon:yes gene_type:complete
MFREMFDDDTTPSVEDILAEDAVNEYILFFKECTRQREQLDKELNRVLSKESLDKFLAKVDSMKPMYEQLKILEDRIYNKGE